MYTFAKRETCVCIIVILFAHWNLSLSIGDCFWYRSTNSPIYKYDLAMRWLRSLSINAFTVNLEYFVLFALAKYNALINYILLAAAVVCEYRHKTSDKISVSGGSGPNKSFARRDTATLKVKKLIFNADEFLNLCFFFLYSNYAVIYCIYSRRNNLIVNSCSGGSSIIYTIALWQQNNFLSLVEFDKLINCCDCWLW